MNKKEIKNCYNKCQGKDDIFICKYYDSISNDGICLYYKIMQNDVVKINNGDDCLTFPQLENILIDNLIEKQYNPVTAFIYDTRNKSLWKNGKIIAIYDELPKKWKQFNNVYEI